MSKKGSEITRRKFIELDEIIREFRGQLLNLLDMAMEQAFDVGFSEGENAHESVNDWHRPSPMVNR